MTESRAVTFDPVFRHFRAASANWGERYHRAPARMSDLDLQLRLQSAVSLVESLVGNQFKRVRLLDVGCGTGDFLREIRYSHVEAVGVDRVPEMVAAAARTNPRHLFYLGDAERLPFQDGAAEIVVSLGVLEYVSNPSIVLQELSRVLVPEGHLVLSIPNGECLFRKGNGRMQGARRFARRTLNVLQGDVSTDAEFRTYRHSEWTVRQVQSMLSDAGFVSSLVRFNTYGLWGRLGRTRGALRFSRWMTNRFSAHARVSRYLAWTGVFLAAKKGLPQTAL